MNTLVIGLGNPILTDDGAGIFVARAVQNALPADSAVDVTELAVGGIRLMEAMIGYEQVVLVDAMWANAEDVGEVFVFDARDLPETLNIHSSHDADLPTALRLGRELGAALPLDEHIHIVTITANQVLDFGDHPTLPVQRAIPIACDAVLKLLAEVPFVTVPAKPL